MRPQVSPLRGGHLFHRRDWPTLVAVNRRIHLDALSGATPAPEVLAAMRPFLAEDFGNPASVHGRGLTAREALAQAREQVAGLVGAAPEQIVFTSNGTEANNLAVKGAAWASRARGGHIVLSAIEQPSVDRAVTFLESTGFTATRVPVDGCGRVSPAAIAAAITPQTLLICLHHAHHDLGVVQDIATVGRLAAERGIPLHVDATASAGWLPLDMRAMNIALLTLAPHRFHGPQGVGVLCRDRRVPLTPLLHGGVQEDGLRGGTENVAGIVGAGVAAALAARDLPAHAERAARLQRQLFEGLRDIVPHLRLNGPPLGADRLCSHLNLSFEFLEGEGLALSLDLQGVAIGSGAACTTGKTAVPPALAAIGLDAALARGNVLLSLGRDNTAEEIAQVLDLMPKQIAKLRALSPEWAAFQAGTLAARLPATAAAHP